MYMEYGLKGMLDPEGTKEIRLVLAAPGLAEEVTDYYRRNRSFLRKFEPLREEEFFSYSYQRAALEREVLAHRQGSGCRFLIKRGEEPGRVIGVIGLSGILYGAFCSAFLGYSLDQDYGGRGYMTKAVELLAEYAFEKLGLHRIEANVMPGNAASIRVLEKVKLNAAMHERKC